MLGRPVWLQLRLMGHLAAGAVRQGWDSFARKMPHTISSAALAAALSSPQTSLQIHGDGGVLAADAGESGFHDLYGL